ncbi:hypothetical protein GGS21DRAFT_531089 [Xylaria nigripes]|nr:hypothetical protein GGS21DRAFT_531089 [Xylaria nigripes]
MVCWACAVYLLYLPNISSRVFPRSQPSFNLFFPLFIPFVFSPRLVAIKLAVTSSCVLTSRSLLHTTGTSRPSQQLCDDPVPCRQWAAAHSSVAIRRRELYWERRAERKKKKEEDGSKKIKEDEKKKTYRNLEAYLASPFHFNHDYNSVYTFVHTRQLYSVLDSYYYCTIIIQAILQAARHTRTTTNPTSCSLVSRS